MNTVVDLLLKTFNQVMVTFQHNWPFLVVSVLVATALRLYMNPDKVSAFLIRYRKVGVLGATAAAVGTPLCSCGTTAVILGMMASMMPWAPIVAFLVASPLTSPQELVYSAGLFGWPFALAFFIASIVLGLLGGLLAEILERSGWLAGQARYTSKPAAQNAPTAAAAPTFLPRPRLERPAATLTSAQVCCNVAGESALQMPAALQLPTTLQMPGLAVKNAAAAAPAASCGCTTSQPAPLQTQPTVTSASCGCASQPASQPAAEAPASGCSCSTQSTATTAKTAEKPRVTWQMFLRETAQTGKNLLLMFMGFAFIGYLLNNLIPAAWVAAVFGPGNVYSVPLAATLGLPLYINSEASLPLVRALIDGGMSQGAALAFLITGAGTSFGAIAGTLTIARWRVTALVIGTLWVGGMAAGFLYDLLLAAHLF